MVFNFLKSNRAITTVKVNYGKPYWHGVRQPEGEALMPTTSESGQQERWAPHCSTLLPSRRKKGSHLLPPDNSAANERLSQLSQWEATIHGTPGLLQWTLCLDTAPLTQLFSSLKVFLSFVLQTCPWFCCSLHVRACNSLLFPSKTIFAVKITFNFKVNNIELWQFSLFPSIKMITV